MSDLSILKRRILVSGKKQLADLVVRNGKIVNVFTGELMEGDIAIVDGMIAGIGSYEGMEVIDAQGKFIVPGFIDGHVHIESAMVTPAEFCRIVLPHGVTTIIADPHEIANVSGTEGIQYMLDASESLPFDAYFMLPSCVPATPFENAGARLDAKDMDHLYAHPRVLGLGEVMDFPSISGTQENMLQKIAAAHAKKAKIDGHAAGISREDLSIYMAAGIRTDHECINAQEAKDRLDLGMYLMVRQGSVARDLEALLPAVTPQNARRCLFVTDDKHLDDLLEEGSIDCNVRLAIKNGIPAITAIQMATLNSAECFGLHHLGAIAPGYQADFLLLEDLEQITIHQVYKKGKLVAEQGKIIETAFSDHPTHSTPSILKDSVRIGKITGDQLAIPLSSNQCHVIEIIPNSLVTNHLVEQVDIENGCFVPSITKDQLKIAVIERHRATGNIGLGIVKGFGIKKGAIASTVTHDSHNLIVVGQNDQDMLAAIHHLKRIQGGLAVVCEGRILASLPLPIAGLMTDRTQQEIYKHLKQLNRAAREIGVSKELNPFLTLSFLALPVIPYLKITDLGLFHFSSFSHISVEQRPHDSTLGTGTHRNPLS
ncbi:adenine deaminase [Thermoflavimicrobium dichotomicum]|uniref:Adenine deaminase n=1 Tax=Thermoflavimicrobium dichotomicum TaxID=46223 RepID=A0A1I3S9A7_9BACL|nr:adenine deaminase [Thermoflavimicrobium dichotomicum]SFJ54121.1 adenine deaminase [Thermoflavimicrobium dichotomicum]